MKLGQKVQGLLQESPSPMAYSSSKLWFNVSNIAIVSIYVVLGIAAAKSDPIPIDGFAWLTLVMSGVVTANKFANKFLEYKYSQPAAVVVAEPPKSEDQK